MTDSSITDSLSSYPHPEYAEIVVVRHGETTWNADGRIQLTLPAPVTASEALVAGSETLIAGSEVAVTDSFCYRPSHQPPWLVSSAIVSALLLLNLF